MEDLLENVEMETHEPEKHCERRMALAYNARSRSFFSCTREFVGTMKYSSD
jgi:hypothetical protein